ncbi:hypothetical protein QCA50_012534 [Cerrena zonata]|uniref:Secreted protein n=1 Tax=Cerrena zonata TaxID=2478898 RepID=A0AAW0FSB1_9APHY
MSFGLVLFIVPFAFVRRQCTLGGIYPLTLGSSTLAKPRPRLYSSPPALFVAPGQSPDTHLYFSVLPNISPPILDRRLWSMLSEWTLPSIICTILSSALFFGNKHL